MKTLLTIAWMLFASGITCLSISLYLALNIEPCFGCKQKDKQLKEQCVKFNSLIRDGHKNCIVLEK